MADFEAKAPEIFITDPTNCKVGFVVIGLAPKTSSTQLPSTEESTSSQPRDALRWVSTMDELKLVLQQPLQAGLSKMLILQRQHSWSRINITVDMFRSIYGFDLIAPNFLKIVMGFNRKCSSKDEDFMGCYTNFMPSKKETTEASFRLKAERKNEMVSYDICYNIRHFEQHGRVSDDPWSCRQSAIHQKYCFDSKTSSFIVIQPPIRFSTGLKDRGLTSTPHPMGLHLGYLAASTMNWRSYTTFVSEQLKECKLHHANLLLSQTLDVVGSIRMHAKTVAKMDSIPLQVQLDLDLEIRSMVGELTSCWQIVQKQLELSSDLGILYDDILKSQGQELLHSNGLKLAEIARQDSAETKAMVSITDKTYQDSRTTRIMTVIALIYLPANLVLSFFSTTLVWFDPKSETGYHSENKSAMRVHPEIWVAVVTTVILATSL
ncbi:hypothetical protein CEP52_014631 [Fusarium oligoseptatum]|uniref:CorA-like transporter domain-containing protein n=1 Tax=Fusarium oligoseptatum TaxID=2604345 RepID=A0A428SKJ4_9HYPO|nr:hypothetical protein CEP52_014631 [Fusarium oligoseptatum]